MFMMSAFLVGLLRIYEGLDFVGLGAGRASLRNNVSKPVGKVLVLL